MPETNPYSRLILSQVIGLFFILSACQATPSADQNISLPLPVVSIEKIAASSTPQTKLTSSPTATLVPLDLPEMARSVYANRLIDFIRIPTLNIWSPVTPVGWLAAGDPGDPVSINWDSPNAQVGWMVNGALPDDHIGNIILYGHNNIESSVFLNLYRLKTGDVITLQTGIHEFEYKVYNVHILPVTGKQEDYVAYLEYLNPSSDLRLTLVSCYPPVSNTHRVVVVAFPVKK